MPGPAMMRHRRKVMLELKPSNSFYRAARTWFRLSRFGLAALVLSFATAAANAQDRHAGFYYPSVTTSETYVARANTMPQAGREMRIGFITGMTSQQLAAPYAPTYAIFAKGEESQKMIIVALSEESFDTLFRARALLAQMTAMVRASDLFREMGVEDFFTSLDLVKLFGFTQLTISDGDRFTHQITID
jgi:purine-cytosine permease-like protein